MQQGSFFSDGARKTIELRGDIDWMRVWNSTVIDAAGAGSGAEFLWLRGLTDNSAIQYAKLAADDSLDINYITPGFRYFNDGTSTELGAPNTTVTRIDATGTVSCTSTAGLVEGSIVRFADVDNANQISGIDFVASGIVTNTSFDIGTLPTNFVDTGAGITGEFRIVSQDPIYAPSKATITGVPITGPNETYITCSLNVATLYSANEYVRFKVPAICGMQELDGLIGRILELDALTNSIVVDINSSGFSAFTFPLHASVPFSLPEVLPVGDYGDTLTGATANTFSIGMILEAGVNAPAGSNGDEIFWHAGKSFSVTNE